MSKTKYSYNKSVPMFLFSNYHILFLWKKCISIIKYFIKTIFMASRQGIACFCFMTSEGMNNFFFWNGPFPVSFSLFLSFQYTVDSIQMFNINKFLPMTGFEPRTSGIGSNCSTNWATTTAPVEWNFIWIYTDLKYPKIDADSR